MNTTIFGRCKNATLNVADFGPQGDHHSLDSGKASTKALEEGTVLGVGNTSLGPQLVLMEQNHRLSWMIRIYKNDKI